MILGGLLQDLLRTTEVWFPTGGFISFCKARYDKENARRQTEKTIASIHGTIVGRTK